MIKLHIHNAAKEIDKDLVAIIKRAFDDAQKICWELIEADDIDVSVYNHPSYTIEKTGIGGRTHTPSIIQIPINVAHEIKYEDMYVTMCHEFHHAMRQKVVGFPANLLETVVSEGLADQFEVEIKGKTFRPMTYRSDIDNELIQEGLKELMETGEEPDFEYYGWFFGGDKYPNWFGYTLGNIIVERYLSDTKKKPSELVSTPASEFKNTLKRELEKAKP